MRVEPFTEASLGDVECVVRSRWTDSAVSILHKELKNPARKVHASVGDLVYDENKPVGFQAFLLRKVYVGRNSSWGRVGGMTVLSPNAPVEAMIDIRAASVAHDVEFCLSFGNTLCRATEKMSKVRKDMFGPESCCYNRFRPVRPLRFLWYFLLRKIFKLPIPEWTQFDSLKTGEFSFVARSCRVRRLWTFDSALTDDFWNRYIEKNEGLVCSRTTEELDWIFGQEVKTGQCVLLGAFDQEKLVGYVVLKDDAKKGKRWRIMDWIAVGNDRAILGDLLKASCRFLKKKTPAMLVETMGYPTYIQDVLCHYLPFRRYAGNNFFCYNYRKRKTTGKAFADACEAVIKTEKSWFFGPYDGDMCM